MRMAFGLLLICAGLFLGRWCARNIAGSPSMRSPYVGPFLTLLLTFLWLAMIAFGLVLVAGDSLSAAVVTAMLLLGLWAFGRFMGGEQASKRTMERSYQSFRRAFPNEPENAVLLRTLRSRYPGWTDGQLHLVVTEYPTLHVLTEAVILRDKWNLSPEDLAKLHQSLPEILKKQEGE